MGGQAGDQGGGCSSDGVTAEVGSRVGPGMSPRFWPELLEELICTKSAGGSLRVAAVWGRVGSEMPVPSGGVKCTVGFLGLALRPLPASCPRY